MKRWTQEEYDYLMDNWGKKSLDLTKTFLHGLIMMMKSNGNEKD